MQLSLHLQGPIPPGAQTSLLWRLRLPGGRACSVDVVTAKELQKRWIGQAVWDPLKTSAYKVHLWAAWLSLPDESPARLPLRHTFPLVFQNSRNDIKEKIMYRGFDGLAKIVRIWVSATSEHVSIAPEL